MDREQLIRAGRLLYGERWQTPLAADLNIGDRRVRAWLAGERPIPAGIAADLRKLVEARAAECRAYLSETLCESQP